jgi:hypothetical protein
MVATEVEITPPEATAQMLAWLNGDLLIQALYAAAALGIADLVAAEAKTAEELAAATSAQARPLYQVLRMLAGHGVFREDDQGRFGLTPLADTLRRDRPGSVREWVLYVGGPATWSATGNLLEAVRTGESAFALAHGTSIDAYLPRHPELSRTFDGWMTRQSGLHNAALVAAYDFSTVRTVVDVGGGQGATLAAILRASPSARGILFDLPHVVADTPPLRDAGVEARCTVIAGSALEGVPAGGDCYLVKRVLMMESDATAATILRHCAEATTADGRVLIIEMVVPPGNDPSVSKDFDVRMLIQREAGAGIRTEAEWRALCDAAGLRLARVIPTASPNSILEAVRA